MVNKKVLFDLMNHDLVPLHQIISEKEKNDLLKKYKIESNQLPKILDTDPVCISIGAKPGQILKIIRKSHTAEESFSYRLVIESNE
jgi:DNA-directed RNA polymerase subunit H (RpoH/RPB5)